MSSLTVRLFRLCSSVPSGLLWTRMVTSSPLGMSSRYRTASSLNIPLKSVLFTWNTGEGVTIMSALKARAVQITFHYQFNPFSQCWKKFHSPLTLSFFFFYCLESLFQMFVSVNFGLTSSRASTAALLNQELVFSRKCVWLLDSSSLAEEIFI